MRPLPRPAHTARDTYCLCISSIRDDDLRQHLEGFANGVAAAAAAFDDAVRATTLHTLKSAAFKPGDEEDHAKLVKNYTQRMAKAAAPARPIYDELKTAPARCPLCDQRQVTTLDHHLPKSGFSLLAVAPTNLIPACSDCNKTKLDTAPRCAEEETLHPYFDDLGDVQWLGAQVAEQRPTFLTFFVDAPPSWERLLAARVRHHFDILDLATLYGAQASTLIAGLQLSVRGQHADGGSAAVRAYLADLADSHKYEKSLGRACPVIGVSGVVDQ
ncbi:hypothetical protein [Amycolatopsis sp. cmx-4-68]|uniref:hypothetical protein n=1 Tax=Amycolatopsis sp. cmx-4-68 TaxID=2790938 RepID=UPI003979F35C